MIEGFALGGLSDRIKPEWMIGITGIRSLSELNQKGYVFEQMSGRLSMDHGKITIAKPIKISAPSSKFCLPGTIDYPSQHIDTELIATLPLGGNLTVAAALAAGLPAAAGVFLIGKLFEKQVEQLSSVKCSIQGDLKAPVTKVVKSVEAKSEQDFPLEEAD